MKNLWENISGYYSRARKIMIYKNIITQPLKQNTMSYVKSALKTCTGCKGNGHRPGRIIENGRWITAEVSCTRCKGTGKVKRLGAK